MDFEILILGTDANAYYMARCCYEAYHKKAYMIGKERLAFTKFSTILHVQYEDLWDKKNFITVLNTFAQKHANKIILLISTNETYSQFISEEKEALDKHFVFNSPSKEIIKSLTNKELFYKTYANKGLVFPKTYYYDCQKKGEKIPKLSFPLVLKPANVVEYNHLKFPEKHKIYKIEKDEELVKVIKQIKENGYQDKLILQEFIPGDDSNLFDAVVYVNTNKEVEFISFAQIGLQERTKSMVGNAAVLMNGINTTKGDVEKQVESIKKFMESIDYQGFAEVDMKYDIRDNTFKVLEINARQGRCSYYVTALGKNLVTTLVEDVLEHKKHTYTFLKDFVILSFVPKGIVKKYIQNKEFKKIALKNWRHVIKPMAPKCDKSIKRFLMLRKRWLHYYLEYKNSYWRV